ncbi:MAG: FAD-dependent oxidoreductase [Acidimicrobiales bacterium]
MTPQPPGADVVVIGGGLVGASLAYELVVAGATTVLVDRRDPGRATDAGAGILSPETSQDPDPDTYGFGLAAAHHYESLIARLRDDGVADTGFAVTGSLLIAERPGDDEFMERAAGLIGGRCPGLVVEIEPAEASRYFPPLGPVRRALFNPAARRVDGRVLNVALRRAAVSRGLRMLDGAATGLEVDRRNGTVTAVVTSEGTVAAGAVALAGGAWTAELAQTLGVALPVAPLKGQIVHLSLPATDTSAWPIVQPVLGYYLVPWPDGRVACGGTMEAEAGFDHRPTAHGVHQLLRECLRTAPGLAQATVVETRAGSRPVTPDGHAILGRMPGWVNAFVATGHGAEGLLLGPYSALNVARTILGLETSEDPIERALTARALDRFVPERFTPA